MIVWKTTRGVTPSWARGADGNDVTWSENQADALLFPDATAANSWASGKQMFGAAQVSVTGKTNPGRKSCDL